MGGNILTSLETLWNVITSNDKPPDTIDLDKLNLDFGTPDFANSPDNTFARPPEVFVNKDFDSDFVITKGRWRLTFSNPGEMFGFNTPGQYDVVQWVDENGVLQSKGYTLDKVSFKPLTNRLIVDITVIDNPIPIIFLVQAVVVLVIIIIGGITANSILEDVSNIVESPGGFVISAGVIAIFLLPLLIPLLVKGKKT